MNLVPESARHLEMNRARQMRVDTHDLAEAHLETHAMNVSVDRIGRVGRTWV